MWQVRYCKSSWHTTVLMKEDQVCQRRGIGAGDEVWQDEGSSIETDGGGKEKPYFFCESRKSG